MKSRTSLTLVALILTTPFAQAGGIDKAKLRKLAELPEVSASFCINYSTTLGFYFNGNKPDPLAEVARIRKQLKGDASDAERYLRLSWLYSKAGREKEADEADTKVIALCRKQMREHPDDMRCLALLGEALVRSGEIKEGETVLRRAVKEAPKEWRAWLALAAYTDLLALKAILGDKSFSVRTVDGKILSSTLNEKKPTSEQIAKMRRLRDEARGYYARAIEFAPRETEPYFRRLGSSWEFAFVEAALHTQKGKHTDTMALLATPECAADMTQIARFSPDNPNRVGTALLIAILTGMQQKNDTVSERPPSFEEFLAEKERPLLDKLPGESGKAARWSMERLEQLTSVPDKATAAAASEFLANVLMVMKKFDETASMQGMGGMGGGMLGGMLDAPAAAAEDGCTAKIVKYLRHAVELDPSRDSAGHLLMALLNESNETRDALEVGHNRVQIKDNAHNRFLLGRIYAKDNQLQAAAKHLRAAVKNDPADLDCRFALIAVLLQRDDGASLKEAGAQLDSAEPLVKEGNRKRSNANFLILRGIHAGLSDQPKQAKELLKQALRLKKGDKNAARAISTLGEPLTPEDRQLAIDYLRARKVTLEQADKNPGAAVTAVRLFYDDITDDDLFYLTAFSQLRELSLRGKSITDAGLAYVEGLTTLEALAIDFTKITDKGLARLKPLVNLRSLNLENARISAAGLDHLEAFRKLEQISLPVWAISSDLNKEVAWKDGLARLSKLPNLRALSVDVSASVTDKELAYLTVIPRLEELHIRISGITDEGMRLLGRCTRLRTLEVSGKTITDDGLAHWEELRHLRELHLNRTRITGAGLVHLQRMTELEVLDLSDSAITDAELANLNGLPNLRKLNLGHYLIFEDGHFDEGLRAIGILGGKPAPDKKPAKKPAKPQITDAGLKHLGGLTNLTELSLFGRPITDDGLARLAGLKRLRQLELGSTKVTKQGVAQLRKAIPELEISR